MTDALNEHGKKLKPRIVVVTQPAQSPDTNMCNLAFFRALACMVRKRRRCSRESGTDRKWLFDLDQLAKDTIAAFNEYSTESLEEMWAYKTLIMQRIVDAEGGNDYSRRRTADVRSVRACVRAGTKGPGGVVIS